MNTTHRITYGPTGDVTYTTSLAHYTITMDYSPSFVPEPPPRVSPRAQRKLDWRALRTAESHARAPQAKPALSYTPGPMREPQRVRR